MVADGRLPASAIVTAEQLTMKPGQKLIEKARELGTTFTTLKLWTAEWKGSGFDPDYAVRRRDHGNWRRTKWAEKDWVAALRAQIAKKQHRHIGDLLMELGVPGGTCQVWSQRHSEWERTLWHSGIDYPRLHWPLFIAWVRHGTIDRYRVLKAEKIASGMPETEAMHEAADEAVNELKHRKRQERRVYRDTVLGMAQHEATLRDLGWRRGVRFTSSHSRRIARELVKVSRWASVERALRSVGVDEARIEQTVRELMAAFEQSPEEGQAKWKKVRTRVMQKRATNEARALAGKAEKKAIEQLPAVKASRYVKQQLCEGKR
jgi:hypothetical protein